LTAIIYSYNDGNYENEQEKEDITYMTATGPTYITSSTTIYQHAHCDHRTNCYLLYLGCTSDGASAVSESIQR